MLCFTPSEISLAFMIDQILDMLIHKMLMIIIWDMAKLLCAWQAIWLAYVWIVGPPSPMLLLRISTKSANNIFNLFVLLFHCLGSSFVLIFTYLWQRRAIIDALWRYSRPAQLWDLYAFTCGPSKFSNANPKLRLLNEYFRLLGKDSVLASGSMIGDRSLNISNEWWRVTAVNNSYTLCATYPSSLILPKSIRYNFKEFWIGNANSLLLNTLKQR